MAGGTASCRPDDQVVEAAKELDSTGFTRAELAQKLGVEPTELKPAFKEARKSGRLEKVSGDEEGKPRFRLTNQ